MRGLERFAPLTGILFVLLVIAAVIVGGESPSADDSTRKVFDYFDDDRDRVLISSIILAIGVGAFLWFAGALRSVLAAAEGPPARLANTAWGGAIVLAVGVLLLAGFAFVAADTVGDVPPVVTQTYSVGQADFYFPVAIGGAVFMLASGLAIVRSGALAAWVGWAGVVLGIAAITFTPAAFIAIILMLIWIVVLSVILFQATARPQAPPPVSTPPAV